MNDQPPPPPPIPPSQNYYSAPSAGPQFPQEMLGPKKSGWPTPIGIIAIVFGGAAALASVIGIFTNSAMSGLLSELGVDKDFMERHWAAATLMPILAAVLGTLLLISGILLIMRRRVASSLMLVWAVAKIAFVIVQAPLNMAMQKEMMPRMMEQQKKIIEASSKGSGQKIEAPDMSGIMDVAAGVGAVVGVVWGMALPVFLLIWFSRRKIREDMASWGRADAV